MFEALLQLVIAFKQTASSFGICSIVSSRITVAITQVAANKLNIKTDAKRDLGSSHCYVATALWTRLRQM